MRPPQHPTKEELEDAFWIVEHELMTSLVDEGHEIEMVEVEDDLLQLGQKIEEWRPHVAFNLLEGFKGISLFDQNVVSYLELLGVPYTGCNPRGLIVARHKGLTKKILSYHGILTPQFTVVPRSSQTPVRPVPFPAIVKSVTEEASIGISNASIVTDEHRLEERIRFIHEAVGTHALVESFIEGRELYVSVLGNQRLETLPVWELRFPKSRESGVRIATERVKSSPAFRKKHGIESGEARDLPKEIVTRAQEISRQAYRLLGLNGYARMDFRLTEDGKLYLLEANPNPHLGKSEDFVQSARRAGLSYNDVVWRILSLGQRWQPEEFSMEP